MMSLSYLQASQQALLGIDRIESQPLSDAPWITAQMHTIHTLPSETAKLNAIAQLVGRLHDPPLPPSNTETTYTNHKTINSATADTHTTDDIPATTATAASYTSGSFYYDWLGSPSATDRPHLNGGPGIAVDPMNFFTPLQSASPCTGRHYPAGSPQQQACVASCPIRRMMYGARLPMIGVVVAR
jgi:hypothetical protein